MSDNHAGKGCPISTIMTVVASLAPRKDLNMFEQDYIMRLIKEMVRAILKLLFQIDTDSPTEELLEEKEEKEAFHALVELIDDGKINEAENQLYEQMENEGANERSASLKTALLFYSYLNQKSDDFLKEHDYSREEIREGLNQIVSRYGLEGLTELWTE